MIAHKYHYKDRQSKTTTEYAPRPAASEDRILILPSSERYFEQMEQLQYEVYNVTPQNNDGCLTAEKFRNHARVFPEGQFIAVDAKTDRVIGLTASMRLDYDPTKPLLESWKATTGDG